MEILSLKWNNHQIVFSHQMNELRKKTSYTDTTLACHGKFYQAHKLVLSTCSDYFKEIFNHITCNNPVIVLKDISCQDLEFLLDYMYIGEVNVKKNELTSLISAAENLQIKGLAVSDENFSHSSDDSRFQDHDFEKGNDKNNSILAGDKDYIKENAIKSSSSVNKELLNKTKDKNSSFFEAEYVSPNNNDNNFAQNDFPGPYVSDIKSDPDLDINTISNELKVEPCTSNTEELSCPDYNPPTKFNFFSSDADFSEGLAQDDISLQSSIDSQNSLPHGPYLQLPYSGYIRRDSTTREKTNMEPLKKDYACSFCGRTFSHRTNQLAHERIHTGEKPFRCLYCTFRTALKGNLKNHIFSRHQADWKSIKHLIFPSKDN